MAKDQTTRICCIGAGYVGTCTSAVLAYKNPSVRITVVDTSEAKIGAWRSRSFPISEPCLQEILKQVVERLAFSTDIEAAINAADLIFICVDTPTVTKGTGEGFALDTSAVVACVAKIVEVSTSDKIIVPCGTADQLRKLITQKNTKGLNFEVLSNPEFLAEGTAIHDLLHPDRVIIGAENTPKGSNAAARLVSLYQAWIPSDRIKTTNTWSSELGKLAANAMLAQRISSINSLTAICESVGADIQDISQIVGLDHRIGPHMLQASIGFGGSCFEKDIRCLVYLAESLGFRHIARYWMADLEMNDFQKASQTERITSLLGPLASSKLTIAVLGFSFKAGTTDVRSTPVLTIVRDLVGRGHKVKIFDPKAKKEDIQETLCKANLGRERAIVSLNAMQACDGAHVIAIATAWDEFRTRPGLRRMDWKSIADGMQQPRLMFDGCNVVDAKYLEGLGMKVLELGRKQAML
ncbi:nucleotide sugar dehydrogenase [Lophiotrema nucula]|uniref:UDP-glucose 6-dehydrogenase n=1 Tax=Lophiotrema nucula TaxID=690887 RepID=A0A6A5Z3N5_9PLEO|nr:nucleotide sugar dehydrogenase [Lophiotrema nucula]